MANDAPLLEQLRVHMPLKSELLYITRAKKSGLVVVDEINGFCTVGMGNMVRERTTPMILSAAISIRESENLRRFKK